MRADNSCASGRLLQPNGLRRCLNVVIGRTAFRRTFVGLLLMPCAISAQAPPARTVDTASIGRAVRAWMQRHRAPALSVAIALDGQPAWSAGFGFADPAHGVVATSRTSYRLASVTKSITATAVMMLAEKGALDLDAPVQKYCPAYPPKRWTVTARLLLAHLGGVRHHTLLEAIRPNTRHFESVAAALDRFKNDDLVAQPGTEYRYSSLGYTILGCAIEGAAGTSYAGFVRDHIFAPAGMIDTKPDDARTPLPGGTAYFSKGLLYKATGKFGRRTTARSIDVSDRLPAGGLVSTVDDMVRFAIALQSGQLVRDSTRELMWTRQHTSDGKPLQFYGLGWLVGEADSLRPKRVWNDGSQPGTRTFLYLRPGQRIIIALMTNMDGAACEELVPRILEAIGPPTAASK
jgi:serine beta-lactamase-like protein LACTB, mitochondrial